MSRGGVRGRQGPLRKIVDRVREEVPLRDGELTFTRFWLVLECGHRVRWTNTSGDYKARCPECRKAESRKGT